MSAAPDQVVNGFELDPPPAVMLGQGPLPPEPAPRPVVDADVQSVSTALVEFDRVAAGLSALQASYGGVLYPVATREGLDAAKAARLALREPRYEVERIRKGAKAPLLAIGRRIDSEAARINGELLKLEEPIDAQIKAREAEIEAEKRARAEAERRRVAEIHARIGEIRDTIAQAAMQPASTITFMRHEAASIVIDGTFAEFAAEAEAAKVDTLAKLDRLIEAARQREERERQLAAERAEFERQRAAELERQRIERERIVAEERAADERRREADRIAAAHRAEEDRRRAAEQAERDRVAAEERAKAKAEIDAMKAKLRAEREENERREREAAEVREAEERRIAFEGAQLLAAQEAERRGREMREAEERRRQEVAEQEARLLAARSSRERPSDEQIIAAVATAFDATPELAAKWLRGMKWGKRVVAESKVIA